jgi:hypothetical protein
MVSVDSTGGMRSQSLVCSPYMVDVLIVPPEDEVKLNFVKWVLVRPHRPSPTKPEEVEELKSPFE